MNYDQDTESTPGGSTLLEMRGIEKRFPGIVALREVAFEVTAGEVHCLLGQNGAGKSTLIKVLAGVHQPNEGQILLDGKEIGFSNPDEAIKAGIGTMYQELDLVETLTVAENIFLGHEKARAGFSSRKAEHRAAAGLLTRLGHPEILPEMEVGELSAAGQQIVSMARALSRDVRLIIMDEPSAVLDSEEVRNLFDTVRFLTASGVAVIYISHRLEEIRVIGDRITVLKDGTAVASNLLVADTPNAELIKLMTGRSITNVFPALTPVADDAAAVLEVKDLVVAPGNEPISFSVAAGEVLGLAGLVGSGRSEILGAIYGSTKPVSGSVHLDGKKLRPGSTVSAVNAGMGLCPEERKSQALLLDDTLAANFTLASIPRYSLAGFTSGKREYQASMEQITKLELRPADPMREARTLSGGNQQKIVLGRWLSHGCRVLLLDEPTRGVDVGARSEIYTLVSELSRAGIAIIVVSSELEEVLGLSHEVLVVSENRIVHRAPAAQMSEHRILDLVMEGTTL
ncbi:sugar ABC transporter ATP-binding protein [Paeniglutamicibacter gangotriensis]|uniref:Ribose ABC transporter ATP-binding protein n=1 Tax=Paeniglutamicibacter gangotriensis Lz1y TaxID=1276920 RepID=M7MXW1_9MICC|nr:sugar ABC transporter ATP-binding protein [Paeniglutamicibacter gangotriensis]EMQ99780.1 ribose ABC transporter ATP-binding protein [Paeniglutamicibacter gangotriensis Lz1y]